MQGSAIALHYQVLRKTAPATGGQDTCIQDVQPLRVQYRAGNEEPAHRGRAVDQYRGVAVGRVGARSDQKTAAG